jgi:lysyl-tRNA synthetase class 2
MPTLQAMAVAGRRFLRNALDHRGWRAVFAVALAAPGLLTVLGALDPSDPPWRGAMALNPPTGPPLGFTHLLAVAAGLGLLVLARAVLQGKRRAADAAIAVVCAVALVRLARGLGDGGTLAAFGLAAALLATRSAFERGSQRRPALLAGVVAIGSVLGAYALATLLALAADRAPSLGAAIAADAAGRVWAPTLAVDDPLGLGLDILVAVGLVAAGIFMRELLRPAPAADGHPAGEHAPAAAIVAHHGNDSLAPFALREDKAYFFARGGMLAYRTLRETAVVSGDPIGPPGAAAGILADFRAFAVSQGWDVVVTAASAEHLADYARLGMRALHIGDEAVVDPRSFSLEGRAIRKVRQSVHRVERHGWSIEVVADHDLGSAARAELETVEGAWRASQSRIQGFAMTLGRLWGVGGDVGGVYVLARDPDGALRAFLRFVEYGQGLSLDCMRRLGDEPNGLNEAMVVAAVEHARARGDREVSLNFAGFAHIMAAEAALSRRQRVLRALLRATHGRFQLERLVRFNDKFFPAWRPRYLVYGRRTHLPLAALRVLQAEAYLRPPSTRRLSARWGPLAGPPGLPAPGASR